VQNAVAVDATATVGTVTRDSVWVRAAGVLHPARFTAGQRRLNRGDKVEILGTLTDDFEKWYKIKSPRGVYFWIYGKYVEPVRPKAPTTKPKATAPGELVTTQPTVRSVTAAPPSAAKEALGALRTAEEALRTVEEALQAEYEKPADHRDFEGLIQKFRNIKLVEKSPLEPYVDYYVKFLTSEIARRVDLADAERLSLKSSEEQKKFDLDMIRAGTEKIAAAVPFSTQGVLSPSRTFPGGATGAKRYIVHAPKTRRLNAYVQSTKGDVDLEQYVGKNVGIYGTTKYDRELDIDIIEAREVVVIADSAQVPTLPQPIVKPMPVPVATPLEVPEPVAEPEPEPAPAPEVEPEPEPIVEPKVTEAEKPEPEPIAEPKVTEAEKSEPEPAATPLEVPEPVVKPIPLEAIAPADKPVPTTKPDIKPVPLPTTRPTTPPERKKKFPKPLPPSGLPLAEPEELPANMPIDENEYE
jgi:hypothetical protein